MRCDTCRYWQMAETDWQAERVRFRRCEAVKEQWHITSAATAQISYPRRPYDEPAGSQIPPSRQAALDAYEAVKDDALREARAYVIDGSQYMAELWTGPDFFCAKFEEQPK